MKLIKFGILVLPLGNVIKKKIKKGKKKKTTVRLRLCKAEANKRKALSNSFSVFFFHALEQLRFLICDSLTFVNNYIRAQILAVSEE